jgi:two-component system aerobic respiration control sensor histidine kinase ArcB
MVKMLMKDDSKIPLSQMKTDIRVLVVEDHEIAQKVAQLVLQGLACSVDIAKTGQEALEFSAENDYHLVFMDVGLPDMDGLTVTANIRSHESKSNLPRVPIVGLTAHANMGAQALEAGMSDFLVKPLTKKSCSHMLNKFVHRSKMRFFGLQMA